MKPFTRLLPLGGLVLSLACGSVAGPPATTAEATPDLSAVTLRVAEQFKGTQSLLAAAGELKSVRYKIEWSEFAAAAPQLQAIAADAADFGGAGDAPVINAIGAGAPIRIVAATQPNDSSGWASLSILVKKNSPIRTLADLRGRTISPTTQGSVGHFLVLAALRKAGIATDQVKIAPLSPADARASFNAGSIDAWATWDPYVATAQANDDARILVTSEGLSARLAFYVATKGAIADPGKHAAIQDFLERMARAQAWTAAHPKDWAASFSTLYSTPLPIATVVTSRYASKFVAIDSRVVKSLQDVADLYARNGVIKPVTVDRAFDNTFKVPVPLAPAGSS